MEAMARAAHTSTRLDATRATLSLIALACAAAIVAACGGESVGAGEPGASARAAPRLVPVEEQFPTCALGDEKRERWGTACLCCHADTFGVGGSLSRERNVARIVVRDGFGDVADMTPNPFSNFFQHLKLRGELDAEIHMKDGQVRRMKGKAPHGDCNQCHGEGGAAGLLGD